MNHEGDGRCEAIGDREQKLFFFAIRELFFLDSLSYRRNDRTIYMNHFSN